MAERPYISRSSPPLEEVYKVYMLVIKILIVTVKIAMLCEDSAKQGKSSIMAEKFCFRMRKRQWQAKDAVVGRKV
jgi:hypothetical protein